MAFGFRRRGEHASNGLRPLLQRDTLAVTQELDRAARLYGGDDGAFDLEVATRELFEGTPTTDVAALRGSGMDCDEFYERELRPNWEGLSKQERAAKIQSFARFANVLGESDAAGMGAIVRTKLLVLAWAYDRAYAEDLSRQIARKPQRFGKLELAAVE